MATPTASPRAPRAARTQRATRPLILDAARRIAREHGWPAVTIRRVADALGYTSPLIYEHFRDKDDALTAILREGFAELGAELSAAAARPVDPADPDAYAREVAEVGLAFARREPALYQLMHGMGGVALDPGETAQGALFLCGIGVGAVEAWARAAGVPLPDPLVATEVLWSALHGVICLALSGRLAAAPTPAEAAGLSLDARVDVLLRQAVDTLLAGWRARGGA